jgi:hypothetical protein
VHIAAVCLAVGTATVVTAAPANAVPNILVFTDGTRLVVDSTAGAPASVVIRPVKGGGGAGLLAGRAGDDRRARG